MTKTPHKHADLIKQWADGAQIQLYDGGKWQDISDNRPFWSDNLSYRVKPEKPKYRVALMTSAAHAGYRYTSIVDTDQAEHTLQSNRYFIRWISDWVEYDA